MAAIPMGLPGALIALALGSEYLHIHSLLGLVVLIGAMVNSAIILQDSVVSRRRGLDRSPARPGRIYSAALQRFRPIILTNFSSVLALVPLGGGFLGFSEQRGMSLVILGGITVSTILSLILIPLLLSRRPV
jgi:hydrophobic/amphiphilic exporter-1 (mainly G- bacteria), HAE1 family